MTIHRRIAEGYPPFQEDEQWQYFSERDPHRTCDVCWDFDEENNFSGEDIPRLFSPTWIQKPKVLHPHTHVKRPQLYGPCRCRMVWSNYPAILAERIDSEIRRYAN